MAGWLMDSKQSFTQEEIDSISKDEVCRYEAHRQLGITNMLDVNSVSAFTHLSKEDIQIIICNYDDLTKLYYDEELIKDYKEIFENKLANILDIFLEGIYD